MSFQNKDILFIINPNSGKKKTQSLIGAIESQHDRPDFVVTQDLEHLDKVFKEGIPRYKVFVIVGGDGSIHKAIPYLTGHSDKYLAVLPNGSGNGFAKELGFSKKVDLLLEKIHKGQSVALDVIDINGNLSINASGLGIDSHVAHRFAETKRRGFANYILLTTKAVFSFKSFEAFLEIDNKPLSGKYMMITIANTRQFGNNARIAPKAKPNDGQYDLVLVKPMPFFRYPGFVFKMFRGKLQSSKYVSYIQTERDLSIRSNMTEYHLDGEPYKFDNGIDLNLIKGGIKMINMQ
jgi:YegS/Rv2252/BmrU family lipid kinase